MTFARLIFVTHRDDIRSVLLAEGVNRWRLLAEWDVAPADELRKLISGGLGRHRPAQLRGSVRQRAGGADERGRKPAESRAYRMGAPVRLQKAVPRTKENAAVERREANAQRHWACAARRLKYCPRLSALRSPHVVREHSPSSARGWKCPALPAPCENRGGGALAFGTPVV